MGVQVPPFAPIIYRIAGIEVGTLCPKTRHADRNSLIMVAMQNERMGAPSTWNSDHPYRQTLSSLDLGPVSAHGDI